MNALVVIAHPRDDSFCHAAAAAAERGLRTAGHEVATIDLYAEGYRAAMSDEERIAYHAEDPILDPQVARHAELLAASELLVFVYPTWWSGLPAILKGWLERTMVPGVGFRLDERTGKVRPGMPHVRRIVGISTWGAPRPVALFVNDNGRRILSRALRMSCGWRARTSWLALYRIDATSEADRVAFLDKIEAKVGGW